MTSKSFCRALWLTAGIGLLLCAAAVACIPADRMQAMMIFFGVVMMAVGAADILGYAFLRGELYGRDWLLAEGVITTLLGLYLLLGGADAVQMVPAVFCVWVLLSGVQRILVSGDLRKGGARSWRIMMAIGAAAAAVGFLMLFHQDLAIPNWNLFACAAFCLQGLLTLLLWRNMRTIP